MMMTHAHALFLFLALIIPAVVTAFYVVAAVVVIGILRDIRDELRRGRQLS